MYCPHSFLLLRPSVLLGLFLTILFAVALFSFLSLSKITAALFSLHLYHRDLTLFRKPSLSLLNKPLCSTRIASSFKFNIAFAAPKPKPRLPANLQCDAASLSLSLPLGHHFIPWSATAKKSQFLISYTFSLSSHLFFSVEWDTNGHEFVIKRRGMIYWSSGALNSNYSFKKFYFPYGPLDYSFINVFNSDEDYVMFTVTGGMNFPDPQDYNKFSNWQLRFDGTIRDVGPNVSSVHGLCYGNSTTSGCKRWAGPECRIVGERFQLRSIDFFIGGTEQVDDNNASLSIGDCRELCWKDCQCSGILTRGNNASNTGCSSADDVSSGER